MAKKPTPVVSCVPHGWHPDDAIRYRDVRVTDKRAVKGGLDNVCSGVRSWYPLWVPFLKAERRKPTGFKSPRRRERMNDRYQHGPIPVASMATVMEVLCLTSLTEFLQKPEVSILCLNTDSRPGDDAVFDALPLDHRVFSVIELQDGIPTVRPHTHDRIGKGSIILLAATT